MLTLSYTHQPLLASKLQDTACKYIGIVEDGRNDGHWINVWQSHVGISTGASYCAAFVSWILDRVDASSPTIRSGLAQKFITTESIKALDVFKKRKSINHPSLLVWKRGNTWKGHVGIVFKWFDTWGYTIEANTSSGLKGSQADGEGVYLRMREIQPYNYFRITHFTEVKFKELEWKSQARRYFISLF